MPRPFAVQSISSARNTVVHGPSRPHPLLTSARLISEAGYREAGKFGTSVNPARHCP